MRNKKEEHSLSQHYQNSSYKMEFALKISLLPFCFFFFIFILKYFDSILIHAFCLKNFKTQYIWINVQILAFSSKVWWPGKSGSTFFSSKKIR